MSRQHRPPAGSVMSRERCRDDHYRKSRDEPSEHSRDRHQRRDRSRSRERRGRRSRSRENRNRYERKSDTDTRVREMSISPTHDDDDDEDRIPTPPPPRISKISIGFNKPQPKSNSIKLSLNSAPDTSSAPALKPKVASVFNDASDEEPEEMPAEARMRMRNIGRETPTSAGPNSFGKTKHGFCDAKNIFQRNLKEAMEKVNPSPNPPKFSSSNYKYHQ